MGSRLNREQNNYFDKPPEMLQDWYAELGHLAANAYAHYENIITEMDQVAKAIEENKGE